MKTQTLYLNNTGDKWIVVKITPSGYDRSPMDFYLVQRDGSLKKRRGDYYYAFGNFAGLSFRHKKMRYNYLPSESTEKKDGLWVVNIVGIP